MCSEATISDGFASYRFTIRQRPGQPGLVFRNGKYEATWRVDFCR